MFRMSETKFINDSVAARLQKHSLTETLKLFQFHRVSDYDNHSVDLSLNEKK